MTKKIFCAGCFGFVRLFFAKFFCECLQQVPPLFFISILQKNGCSKTPEGPILLCSALGDLQETKKISLKNRIFFQFFSHAGTVEENT